MTHSQQRNNLKCCITQINLHDAHKAMSALRQRLDVQVNSSASSIIVLAQEPHFNKNFNITGFSNYNVSAISDSMPRSAIITSKDISFTMLSEYCDADNVSIITKWNNKNIILCSSYMASDSQSHPPQILAELVQYCQTNKLPLIIGADCNSHSSSWGSTNQNARGDKLDNFIIDYDLLILNSGSRPTFSVANRQEVIDITLANIEGKLTANAD